jgi:lipopolysaccharide biosynthesis glycosyltransferase
VKPSCCICYTTDPAYLLPSFVSAIQARHHAMVNKADIVIYSFGATPRAEAAFARASAAENIQFIPVPAKTISGANAMLARLFLSRYVAPDYDRFLYIDGDTQITASLDPLLDFPVPRGQFLAATDPMTFAAPGADKHGREITAYFSSIGIPPQEQHRYFNTGVLFINRDGWEEIGLEAWSLFEKYRAQTRFPDQDALNLAGLAKCIPMSLTWNFPIFMRNARVAQQIRPRITHFMGSPKPWHGVFLPWGKEAYQPYLDIIEKHPALGEYLPRMKQSRKIRYFFQQKYKYGLETLTWAMNDRRQRILNYEDSLSGAPGWKQFEPGPHLA